MSDEPIKYDRDPNPAAIIQIWGNIVCATAPYRPAVFTSKQDDTVGEIVSDGYTNVYYFQALYINDDATPLTNIRISYAQYALHDHSLTLKDSQIMNCTYGILDEWWGGGGYSCYLTNVLMSNVQVPVLGMDFSVFGCNLTIDGCQQLGDDWLYVGSNTMTFVNSLLVGVTNYGPASIITNYTACPADNSVFQTVGAGGYYLATNSPYRNAGTTNLDPATLADLATKTTYPPIVYSNVTISAATTFSPQAQRDTDQPDLGYHYDSLDYVFGGCDLYTNLTFTPGTAVGWYEDYGGVDSSGQPYGISLNDGANLTSTGTATQPCWIARTMTVQEGGNGKWTANGWMAGIMINGSGSGVAPQLNNQFTKWSTMANDGNHFRDNWAYGVANFSNCEFYSGSSGSYWPSLYFTNCLFFRITMAFWDQVDAPNLTFQNCTFYNGAMALCRNDWQSPSFWTIKNTVFDGTAFFTADNFGGDTNYTAFDYNAYNASNTSWQAYDFGVGVASVGTLETVGPNDVTVTNFNWQTSWLGNYYLPTNSPLINTGSCTADVVGLYHFTTQTDQVKETNSVVDIGYHYVAVDASGNPIDTDGDGVPDYLEDANGNGSVNSGETDWNSATDLGLKVFITRPRNGSILP